MNIHSFPSLFSAALERRKSLFDSFEEDKEDGKTDAYRLFHGIAEGWPGFTIDRYGSLILLQTFRDPLTAEDKGAIESTLQQNLSYPFFSAYNHRAKAANQTFDLWHQPLPEALPEFQCREFGVRYWVRARHPGIDPWLFLDLRVGRRFLRQSIGDMQGVSVLNLFAYTCSVGVSAAAAGASEVWNVDFASSNLEIGRRNAVLNQISKDRFHTIEEDCLAVTRQLAGLSIGGRRGQSQRFKKFEPREFDIVFLDPPRLIQRSVEREL